ncbi:hypothetical protein NEOLEDRAFT_183925 [Neolentinus lepideus HHB14362 ss-1]|uniref:RRM domain-containing protein n=1 Tax=Neolentinus lepideus HHB14362 ss-1 TaxID=1314782 RepID=A0A165TP83_9AGAM|nr:hypothetical protein NEOLEDRAFT_183925 [Neolentinus lepideus HHB14362 ss-1]
MMLKKMLFKKDALTSLAACTSGCTVGRSSTARSRLILRRALSSTPPLAVKSEAAKQQAIERLKRQEAYEREYKKSARHPLNRQEPYRPYKLSERIFVRGIPDYVQPWDAETKLHEMFSSFGEILSIDLDATARPGNYRCAYIKYRTTESAQAAVAVCEKDPVFIDKDHLLQVEPFNPTRQLKERLYFNPVQLSRDDITNILLPYASVIEKHSALSS